MKPLPEGNFSVTYCEDQRKAYSKDAATGHVKVTTPALRDFSQWTLMLSKGPAGDWQVFRSARTDGVKSCRLP